MSQIQIFLSIGEIISLFYIFAVSIRKDHWLILWSILYIIETR